MFLAGSSESKAHRLPSLTGTLSAPTILAHDRLDHFTATFSHQWLNSFLTAKGRVTIWNRDLLCGTISSFAIIVAGPDEAKNDQSDSDCQRYVSLHCGGAVTTLRHSSRSAEWARLWRSSRECAGRNDPGLGGRSGVHCSALGGPVSCHSGAQHPQ